MSTSEKESRRDAILDVALKAFYAGGYDGVSMSDLAERAGVKKPTLYTYFRSKEALFFAVVARGAEMVNAMARKEAEKQQSGSVARAVSRFYRKYPEYSWADSYFRSGRFDLEDAENPDIRKLLDLQKEMFDLVSDGIGAGMDDGTLLPDIDPLVMAVWTALVTENTNNLRPDYKYVLARGGVTPAQFAAETMRLLKRAILAGEEA